MENIQFDQAIGTQNPIILAPDPVAVGQSMVDDHLIHADRSASSLSDQSIYPEDPVYTSLGPPPASHEPNDRLIGTAGGEANSEIDQAIDMLPSNDMLPGHGLQSRELEETHLGIALKPKTTRRGRRSDEHQNVTALANLDTGQHHCATYNLTASIQTLSAGHPMCEHHLGSAGSPLGHTTDEIRSPAAKRGKNSSSRISPDIQTTPAADGDDEGLGVGDSLTRRAPSSPKTSTRQSKVANRTDQAGGEEGPADPVPDASRDAPASPIQSADPIIAQIVQMHRMRRRWLKARNSLILQGKAFGRALSDGDKDAGSKLYESVSGQTCDDLTAILAMTPFAEAAARFDVDLKKVEKDLIKLAKKLPVASFIETVPGFGFGSLAAIVGEAGDIGAYRTVSGLWKRMGLAVIDGGRQRKVSDADLATIHGYSPERRSVVWNAGNGLIGGMGHGKRPFVGEDIDLREDWSHFEHMFVRRLRHEAERDLENMSRPATKDPKTGQMRESFSAHAAARAKRYVEKKFLIRLYAEWRRAAASIRPESLMVSPLPYQIAAE